MNIHLDRFAYTPMGVFGNLSIGEFNCYTVERPWLDNQPNVSCIPIGMYPVELGMYNKGGYSAYEIMGVKDRSLIKIHIANTMKDVVGCIGVGSSLGWVHNNWAVMNSAKTLKEFMEECEIIAPDSIVISNLINAGNVVL